MLSVKRSKNIALLNILQLHGKEEPGREIEEWRLWYNINYREPCYILTFVQRGTLLSHFCILDEVLSLQGVLSHHLHPSKEHQLLGHNSHACVPWTFSDPTAEWICPSLYHLEYAFVSLFLHRLHAIIYYIYLCLFYIRIDMYVYWLSRSF